MSSLSELWNGEQHWLEPDELFPADGCVLVVAGWDEEEEEDVLSPFESSSFIPILEESKASWDTPSLNEKFPLRRTEQAWGSLSVVLSAFATVAGVTKKQYQHVWPDPDKRSKVRKDEVKWSFQTDEFITERM